MFRTLKHLRLKQIFYQLYYRINKICIEDNNVDNQIEKLKFSPFVLKNNCLIDDNLFRFLNVGEKFERWNGISSGMLWAYNLNYMDWLGQENLTFDQGKKWIDIFISDLPKNKIGLDPYPIALRSINWIKFISKYNNFISNEVRQKWNDSLYSQVKLLEKKVEYHLLGNHVLEDYYALFIASLYFQDGKLYDKVSRLLVRELNEEILPDGAHYEQSPMYHCILLDRLLDCYNFSSNNFLFKGQDRLNLVLLEKSRMMLGHLSKIIYSDGSIPLLNDSANGIAPLPQQIFDYAKRLNVSFEAISLCECGYRKFHNNKIEVVLDVGDIKASYQPGHSHADTFNFEMRVDGKPFIVDTGISTYNKTERRQYERSTAAHNTVTIADKDSSEVWGGFRIGKRAKVSLLVDEINYVKASHNGFGRLGKHIRSFELINGTFTIIDEVTKDCSAIARLHLAPEVVIHSLDSNAIITNIARIAFDGASGVEVTENICSTEYNLFKNVKVIEISFKNKVSTTITPL